MSDVFEPQRAWPREYTDAELLDAMREVQAASEYAGLSARIYEDERLDRHPSVGTIERRLESWSRAKQLAEEDDD